MNQLIKEIVDADERARKELEEIKQMHAQVATKMMKRRPEIEAEFKKDAEDRINLYKTKLENEFEKKTLQYSVQYEKSLEKLIDRFNKNKDSWVESIYKNCLNT